MIDLRLSLHLVKDRPSDNHLSTLKFSNGYLLLVCHNKMWISKPWRYLWQQSIFSISIRSMQIILAHKDQCKYYYQRYSSLPAFDDIRNLLYLSRYFTAISPKIIRNELYNIVGTIIPTEIIDSCVEYTLVF